MKRTLVVALGLAAGCALRGDVRKVELQVEAQRAERARTDAERAAQLDSWRTLVVGVKQALVAQQAYLVKRRGDVRPALVAVQQQLVQVQELTGQSQQRLSELRARIEERAQQPVPPLDTTGRPAGPSGGPGGARPGQMYDLLPPPFRPRRPATPPPRVLEVFRVSPPHQPAPPPPFFPGETGGGDSAA